MCKFQNGVFFDRNTVRAKRKNPENLNRFGLDLVLPILFILKLAVGL